MTIFRHSFGRAADPAAPLAALGAAALLDRLGRLGLARYLRDLDEAEPSLVLAMRDGEAAAAELGTGRIDWPEQCAALLAAFEAAEGSLPRLAVRLALSPAELFLIGLTACCEARPAVALAVAALQAPAATGRLSVHLALDLAQRLFDDAGMEDAVALAAGKLTDCGLIAAQGEDPLPQRVLAIHLPLWRALAGGTAAWPGCRAIPAASTAPSLSVERAAEAIAAGRAGGVVIRGPPGSGRAAVAAMLADRLGLTALEAPAATYCGDPAFATACRDAGWLPVVRMAPATGEAAVLPGGGAVPVAILAGSHGAVEGDRLIELALAPPPPAERLRLWHAALGGARHRLDRETLAGPALYPGMIDAVARSARLRAETEKRPVERVDLLEARLALAPDGLGRLARAVTRGVGEAALVTTAELAADLAALIARCRRRESIWDGLGPSLEASATRGVRALFAGESGTGKTMAASYVATALGAPLYRCDLAAVMNKYIGESEKNLGQLLDLAEAADVVLLFDEADALFGRRTEGGETGERYANMLTNYLLTRLEAHNGIVILTSNAKTRIDPAFWRRLDQVIDFPLPGYQERLALWRSHLGDRAPSQAVLEQLAAYCDLPGGGVRNAVLGAAALAPPDGPIGLDALGPVLSREYAKLRRTLPAGLALAMRAAG